jgi:hypothetical protein
MIDKLYDLTTNDVIGFIKIQEKKETAIQEKRYIKKKGICMSDT